LDHVYGTNFTKCNQSVCSKAQSTIYKCKKMQQFLMFQNTMHNVPNVTRSNNVTDGNVPKHDLQKLQNATVWMSESTNHNLWRLQNANSLCIGTHKHNLQMLQNAIICMSHSTKHILWKLQNANKLCIQMHNAQCFPRVDWDSKVCESCPLQLNSWTISIMFVNCKSPKNYLSSPPQSSKTSWLSEWTLKKGEKVWIFDFQVLQLHWLNLQIMF